jgi:transcriptional regulator GlxA family with amidase domain
MTSKRTFAFLVLPQVHTMDLAGPDQVLLEAIDYGAPFVTTYIGIDQAVVSSSGMHLSQGMHYSNMTLQKGDFLIIPGSNVSYILSDEFRAQKDLFAWIKAQHAIGVQLVSVCAGSFVLGLCGLLDGIECTTHFKRTKQLQSLFPRAFVKENVLFIGSNTIYTSAGIAAGIDLMLHVVEQLQGPYFAHKVAREMVVYNRRDGLSTQQSVFMDFRNHIHNGIHAAQDYIIEHIDKKSSLLDLANIALMSERNFTRIFKRETGITVNQYINTIRKEVVVSLVKNPDLTRKQIANKVGLESEKQLMRLMRE